LFCLIDTSCSILPQNPINMDFFSIDNMQRGKQAVHIAQAVFIFLSWCIMIGVLHNAFLIVGGPAWFFTLVRGPLIYRGFHQLIDSLVLPECASSNIPNIDAHIRPVPEMGKPLRLRHPRHRLHSLLALGIRVLGCIQQHRPLRRRLRH